MVAEEDTTQHVERIKHGQIAFVRSPGHGAIFPVRALIPHLKLVAPDTEDARLEWMPGARSLSDSLDGCIWEFLDLADASDTVVLDFAKRYGVLTGTWSCDSTAATLDDETRSESTAAWRQLAQSMGAVIEFATALDQGDVAPGNGWLEPYGMLMVMRNLRSEKMPLTAGAVAGGLALLDVEAPRLSAEEILRSIVAEFMRDTEVGWVPPIGRVISKGARELPLTLTIRANGFASPEHSVGSGGPMKLSPRSFEPGWDWQVDRLLPVLAAQLVFAVEPGRPGEFYRCSRCRHRARVIERRPGTRKAWFGDHEYCRERHLAAIKLDYQRRTADQRNAARRAQRAAAREAKNRDDDP